MGVGEERGATPELTEMERGQNEKGINVSMAIFI